MSHKKSETPRDARMELRMTADEKAILEEAAALGGEDTASFVRRASIVEARRLLATFKGHGA